jgi:general secretion pathway protein A
MYLRYFNLNEAPFSITPDPAFVFLSPRHRDALAHLLYGIGKGGSGGFVQLTGEVGTGKTTLCRCLLEQIPEGTRIALLLNTLVTPKELLAAISEELGIYIGDSVDSTRLLVDGLNRYLLDAHARGERVVVVIDEAQNLSPEALEQVRLLTNLETSKEKLLQIVLLGQPELRELLQRRSLRQLAQRITARYHLTPLGPKDTHLYVRHRMQVAGAQRNPFRRGAMNALYQRSQGIPRLINIIADRSLVAAFAKERLDVTATMVHAAANEVQLGEKQVRSFRWPWLAGAAALLVVAITSMLVLDGFNLSSVDKTVTSAISSPEAAAQKQVSDMSQTGLVEEPAMQAVDTIPAEIQPEIQPGIQSETQPGILPGTRPETELTTEIDSIWLDQHQSEIWQELATLWRDNDAASSIQAACDGDSSLGYACLHDQGSWSKIKRLGLPLILVLSGDSPAYVLLRGIDNERLLLGGEGNAINSSRQAVETRWLGAYIVVWPQAAGWPREVKRGDNGPAVATIMAMATRVEDPYFGGHVFDMTFENWLKSFQFKNGLEADGVIGRNTLLHLMTASIEEPQLLQEWEN